ncbi:N/A [soil metagenome]
MPVEAGAQRRGRKILRLPAIAFLAAVVLVVTACSAGQGERQPAKVPVEKVVILIKENRTFDNLFGRFPGAEGATHGKLHTGERVPLKRGPDVYPHDIAHNFFRGLISINGGRMNGFDLIPGNQDLLGYTQYHRQDIPAYWSYARHFLLGDRMFASMYGPTPPEHMYLVAASSGRIVSHLERPERTVPKYCDSPTATFDRLREHPNIQRWERNVELRKLKALLEKVPACVKFHSIFPSLEERGVSWRYYAKRDQYQNIATAFDEIRNTDRWQNVVNPKEFLTDARAGTLADVSYLIPPRIYSEHPFGGKAPTSMCVAENWTVRYLNALMKGPDWEHTAVFIVWDDYGGLYDHLRPPMIDDLGLGIRVPLLVISPWVKAQHISHSTYEFSSLLAFIERLYGIEPLTERDAAANDLWDAFDFEQKNPVPPLILQRRPQKQTPEGLRCK